MRTKILGLLFLLLLPGLASAERLMKQSTATTVNIHLVTASTGAALTGATVTSITATVIEHSDTLSSTKTDLTVTSSGGTSDAVEVGFGDYNLEIPAARNGTLGRWTLCYAYTNAVTTCDAYRIVASAVWDSLVTSVSSIDDFNETDCSTIASATSPMGRICSDKFLRYQVTGTADSGTTTTIVDTERTEPNARNLVPGMVVFTSGNLLNQYAYITTFDPATDTVTFSPAVSEAVTTHTYEIRAVPDFLRPTTSGRTLDVTATGAGGVDFGNIEGGLGAAEIDADASTEFATTLMGTTFEGAHTFKHFLQYGASALFGKYNSSAGTFNFRDIGDTKNRIVYVTTATARSTVTLSPD